MPYLLETVRTGKVIEKRKKYTARYGIKGIPRSENRNPTPEEMEKINQINAERKLRWIINANFTGGDFHIVVGYGGDFNPEPEEARNHFEKFMRDARKIYKKEGKEFKFVFAIERGERGQKKIHMHMVCNYMDTRKLSAVWPYGRIKYNPLDNTGQYADLAAYIIKRTSKTYRRGDSGYKKRYSCSRNLTIPEPENEVIDRARWIKEPKALWGYYIEKDKTVNGISNTTGYPYQFYSMVKLPEQPPRKCNQKKE